MQETQPLSSIQSIRFDYTTNKLAVSTNQVNIYEKNQCIGTINRAAQILRWSHPKYGSILGIGNENEFELFEERIEEWIQIWKYEGDSKLLDVKIKDMQIAIALNDRIEFYKDCMHMGMIELDDLDDDIKCISWYKGKENMLSIGTDKALYIYFEELNCIWQFLCKMELEGINEITWKQNYIGVAHNKGCNIYKLCNDQLQLQQKLCDNQIVNKVSWNIGCTMISLELKNKTVRIFKCDDWSLVNELTDSKIEQL